MDPKKIDRINELAKKKEADVIFEKVDNKNNLALADILSNYL